MEVAYFYVKNYLGLENKGYNFHGEYDFSFDIEKGILSYNKNRSEIPKDFFGKNIISVNAIVGENGVGKTRILKFLYQYLNKGIQGIKLNGLSHEFNNWLDIKSNFKYMIIYIKNGFFYISSNIFTEGMELKCHTYYYSNIFDYDAGLVYREYLGNNSKNLSVGEEVFKKSTEKDFSDLSNIKLKNDIRQIKFIRELENNENKEFYTALKKEMLIPNYISFKFSYMDNIKALSEDLKEQLSISYEEICKDLIDDEGILSYINTCIIINLLVHMGEKNISVSKVEKSKNKYKDILKTIQNKLGVPAIMQVGCIEFNLEKKIVILNLMMNCAIELIELCEELESEEKSSKLKEEPTIGMKLLRYKDKEILNYNWNVFLSSGEKGMLRLFSSLYEELKDSDIRIKDLKYPKKSIVLLIDEFDATFHPEWQRKSLNLLLIYLENYLKFINNHVKIQLIISSHSPFLVADLPKEKIVSLDKEGAQNNKFNIKAFGSNILDIYKEGMFLDTTFGEFARQKIKKVIKNLEGLAIEDEQMKKEEIQKVIDMIGEDLIRERLQRKYNEVFISQSIIKNLEEKIKELSYEEKIKLIRELEKNLDK